MGDPAKAVVFDVGRVLFQWQLRALFEKLIEDPDELEWFLTHVISEEWHFRHDRGETLATMLPERIQQFPEHTLLIAAYAVRFNETVPGPVEGTHELVQRLFSVGVPLYCLTNFGAELFMQFKRAHTLFDFFEDIIVSGEEGVAKPSPRIYEIAEERTGRSGSALFFTDDNPANVAAARERGWDAHVFTDARSLESQLEKARLL
ncbi:MAG: HAD family phosphatase [Pseudomonadota bacterium]